MYLQIFGCWKSTKNESENSKSQKKIGPQMANPHIDTFAEGRLM
jgi:hypothetical protein